MRFWYTFGLQELKRVPYVNYVPKSIATPGSK